MRNTTAEAGRTSTGALAASLRAAETEGRAVPALTAAHALSVVDGYAIQDALVASRLADDERLVGPKLGLTSRAKQERMGIDVPIHGWLTNAMVLAPEEPVSVGTLIHPRVEPEMAFVLGGDVRGPGATHHDVLAATTAVCAGLEVIDSRYEDFRFTLPDVVADNASASRFVLGPRTRPGEVDLTMVGCVLEVDGELVATAAGAAIMGHPAAAVASLANTLAADGQYLKGGWTVLAGALTDAVTLHPGTSVTAAFGHLGSMHLRGVE